MTLALYRKYRPKTLGELIGQETSVQIIKNAAKDDKIGHAYLFYGPRGTGKTTTSRLVAKLLNCEKRKADKQFHGKGEPCNECRACAEIDGNISMDVIEIDAASNRGIDEIKNLKESVKGAPVAGSHKIYIIDEAHMLTTPAMNALLKTLEEPPQHAVFILATTEYEKIPATIASRTQRFLFKRISKMELVKRLEMIATEEGIDISKPAIELIAACSEGGARDAISLLDQVKSMQKKIDLAAVERLTGRTGLKKVENLSKYLLSGDSPAALEELSRTYEEGLNVPQLTKDLIQYLRKVLALKADPDLESYFAAEMTPDELEALKALAPLMGGKALIVLIRSLIRAYTEMRYSPFSMVPLEIAILENADAKASS